MHVQRPNYCLGDTDSIQSQQLPVSKEKISGNLSHIQDSHMGQAETPQLCQGAARTRLLLEEKGAMQAPSTVRIIPQGTTPKYLSKAESQALRAAGPRELLTKARVMPKARPGEDKEKDEHKESINRARPGPELKEAPE